MAIGKLVQDLYLALYKVFKNGAIPQFPKKVNLLLHTETHEQSPVQFGKIGM